MTTDQATPDGILQLGLSFWGAKTLLSAVELGVFTVLARGPRTAESVRTELDLDPRGVEDFLDALVSLGMLERTQDEYANTAATDLFLDRTKPSYVGGILEMADARLYPFWGALTEALRTGEPQNEVRTGGDFFADLYSDRERLQKFLHAMTGLSTGTALALAQKFPWSRYSSVADIAPRRDVCRCSWRCAIRT